MQHLVNPPRLIEDVVPTIHYRASEIGALNSDVEPAALVAVAVKNAPKLPSCNGLPVAVTKLKLALPVEFVVTVVLPR